MAKTAAAIARVVLFLVFVVSSSRAAEARDHLVGGKADGWKVPSSETDSLNNWAKNTRFHVGDTLVWKYDPKKDSVLQVTRDAYLHCNTTNPIAVYNDGKKTLNHSGPFYFISGAGTNCEKGEKLIVVVMSPRDKMFAPAPSPAASSQLSVTPASSPTSAGSCLNEVVMMGTSLLLGILALLI